MKMLHIGSVLLSGGLFGLRGLMMLARMRAANALLLRVASMAVDTALLGTAIGLAVDSRMYPITHHWLTVKTLLLLVYILLGALALRLGRTRAMRVGCFFAALAVYLFILSVARAHHPAGMFAYLLQF